MTTYVDMQLDLSPLTEPEYEATATLAERFAEFHRCNPHVADALEALAEQWLAAGHRKVGMKALVERLRWESGIRTQGSAPLMSPEYAERWVCRWHRGNPFPTPTNLPSARVIPPARSAGPD